MREKYVCKVKEYYLSFENGILIRENDVVDDITTTDDLGIGASYKTDFKMLDFNGKKFMCDLKSFEKYFIKLSLLRNQKIEEILS